MFGKKNEDEVEKLREEVEQLKKQLMKVSERLKEKTGENEEERHHEERTYAHGYAVRFDDLGERISEYVTSMVEGILNGIVGELDRTIIIGRHGRKARKPTIRERVKVDPKTAADVMSALGNEHRIRILGELVSGGLYAGELQERLHDIGASTLSSHLDVLEKAGMIVQEKARGRYLITMAGRLAYQMANEIAKQVDENALDTDPKHLNS